MTPLTVRVPKEERLAREGDTLGDLLERLRECAFPLLIAEPAWNRVVARARDLPRAMAASPFGFEVPLVETVAAQLEKHQAFGNLTVHVDVDRQGIGPRLGMSCTGGLTRLPGVRASCPHRGRELIE